MSVPGASSATSGAHVLSGGLPLAAPGQQTGTPAALSTQDQTIQAVLARIQYQIAEARSSAANAAGDPEAATDLTPLTHLQEVFGLLSTLPARAQAEVERTRRAYEAVAENSGMPAEEVEALRGCLIAAQAIQSQVTALCQALQPKGATAGE